jgi:hypothetical protein
VLNLQKLADLAEALRVDATCHAVPSAAHRPDLVDTMAIAMHELPPQRPAGAQRLLPAHAMMILTCH